MKAKLKKDAESQTVLKTAYFTSYLGKKNVYMMRIFLFISFHACKNHIP
jgi:hypothetical protein